MDRFAFIPQLIVICILFGLTANKFDLSTASEGDPRTIAGNRYVSNLDNPFLSPLTLIRIVR